MSEDKCTVGECRQAPKNRLDADIHMMYMYETEQPFDMRYTTLDAGEDMYHLLTIKESMNRAFGTDLTLDGLAPHHVMMEKAVQIYTSLNAQIASYVDAKAQLDRMEEKFNNDCDVLFDIIEASKKLLPEEYESTKDFMYAILRMAPYRMRDTLVLSHRQRTGVDDPMLDEIRRATKAEMEAEYAKLQQHSQS